MLEQAIKISHRLLESCARADILKCTASTQLPISFFGLVWIVESWVGFAMFQLQVNLRVCVVRSVQVVLMVVQLVVLIM